MRNIGTDTIHKPLEKAKFPSLPSPLPQEKEHTPRKKLKPVSQFVELRKAFCTSSKAEGLAYVPYILIGVR